MSDPLPTWLLIKCLVALNPILTNIVNASLSLSNVPRSLKVVIIKQVNLSLIFKNYRPVSNLKYISKIIGRVILELSEHLLTNSIYEPMQSAYRHGHITETTFTNLCSLLTDMVIAQKQHLRTYAVCLQTWSYHRNNIYEPMQSAYRHGHITETAFMNLCSLLTDMVISQKQHLRTYAVCLQTWSYHRNNIYEPMQSAYRHGHITETAFMNLCSLLTDMVISQKQHLRTYAVCLQTWSYHRNSIYEPMQSAYRHGHITETTFTNLCSLLTDMVISQKQHL